MIFRSHEAHEWGLTDLSFEYRGFRYEGKGLLRWVPEKGFHLDGFVDRKKDLRTAGKHRVSATYPGGLIRREHYRPIRAKSPHHKWILAPDYPMVFLADLDFEGRVSLDIERVIFCQRFPGVSSGFSISEESRFSAPRLILPEAVATTERLGDDVLSMGGSRTALSWSDTLHKSRLRRVSNDTVLLETSLLAPRLSLDVNAWTGAVRDVLGLLTGHVFEPSTREIRRRGWVYTQVRAVHTGDSPEGFVLFPPRTGEIDRSRFVGLVDFMVSNPPGAAVLRGLRSQLSAAAVQAYWPVRELLIATALEAALRSVYNDPFVEGAKSNGYVNRRMSEFQKDYLDGEWREVRKAVVKAHERLRHRNAHPDWMLGTGGQWSDAALDQALLDIRLLERFYGAFVLALARIDNVDPEQVLHGP